MLSKKHVEDYCCLNEPTCKCKYLHVENSNYYCLKLMPKKKKEIDDLINDVENKYKEELIAIFGEDFFKVNLNDNCEGYPYLKNKEQGYDKN